MLEEIMSRNLLLYCMAGLGGLGAAGMFTTQLSYRRFLRHTQEEKSGLKEKWLKLWRTRDRLLAQMNRFVWYPALFSTALLALAVFLTGRMQQATGLSLDYLYLGTAIPILLLLFRQAMDFTYREELLMDALKDYVDHAKREERSEVKLDGSAYTAGRQTADVQTVSKEDRIDESLRREAMVEQITESIRQTAAAGSHFRDMLSPEEEEIMREVIREFLT